MEGTIAEIRMFAGNFAPKNWAYCAGTLVAIAQNTALFSLLGTTYGGDGRTTFGLPDLRGRVPVGTGTGPGLTAITLGEMGGTNTVTLLSTQMPMHNHVGGAFSGNATMSVSSGNATQEAATAGASLATPGGMVSRVFTGTLGYNTETPNTVLNNASVGMTGLSVTTGVSGGSQPHDNMQPYLGMNYIICMYGLFPSRN